MYIQTTFTLPHFINVHGAPCSLMRLEVPHVYITPASRTPTENIKLNSIIDESLVQSTRWKSLRLLRRRTAHQLQKPTFHYTVILLVIIDLVVVLVDLLLAQLSSPCLTAEELKQYNTSEQRESCLLEHSPSLVRADLFLFYFSALLLSCFVLEVLLSLYAFGWKYFKNPLYALDATIVCASFVMELYFHYGNIGRAGRAAAAIVILRLWKIIRAVHAVAHSITLKNRVLLKKLQGETRQAEQTLQKQAIRMHFFINMLAAMGKLPPMKQVDSYVNHVWAQRNKPA